MIIVIITIKKKQKGVSLMEGAKRFSKQRETVTTTLSKSTRTTFPRLSNVNRYSVSPSNRAETTLKSMKPSSKTSLPITRTLPTKQSATLSSLSLH